jgi:hypothetical protein
MFMRVGAKRSELNPSLSAIRAPLARPSRKAVQVVSPDVPLALITLPKAGAGSGMGDCDGSGAGQARRLRVRLGHWLGPDIRRQRSVQLLPT